MGHVTMTPSTCGIVKRHKADTCLALAVPEIFQARGVKFKKMCHVILTTLTWGTVNHQNANSLHVAKSSTKFEVSSCCHSGGGVKF